jgi:hypothetical protein
VHLPLSFADDVSADDALCHLRAGDARGLLSGYLGDPGFYPELHAAAAAKGVRLLNAPDESQRAMEFDRFYPLIAELTAPSRVVAAEADLEPAAALGFPLFIKGAVKSAKEHGLAACTVTDRDGLRRAFHAARRRDRTARGKLIARVMLPLRYSGEQVNGFPVAREYRMLLYAGRPLGCGYYWDGADPFGALTAAEGAEVLDLALEAARRVGCPLVAVDVGQLDDGSWRVIEVGDPQYSGIAHVSHHQFLTELRAALG